MDTKHNFWKDWLWLRECVQAWNQYLMMENLNNFWKGWSQKEFRTEDGKQSTNMVILHWMTNEKACLKMQSKSSGESLLISGWSPLCVYIFPWITNTHTHTWHCLVNLIAMIQSSQPSFHTWHFSLALQTAEAGLFMFFTAGNTALITNDLFSVSVKASYCLGDPSMNTHP